MNDFYTALETKRESDISQAESSEIYVCAKVIAEADRRAAAKGAKK